MNKVKVADKNLPEGVEVVKQKRGRKPKQVVVESTPEPQKVENIHVFIEEQINNGNNLSLTTENIFSDDTPSEAQKPGAKKRGRKPKQI